VMPCAVIAVLGMKGLQVGFEKGPHDHRYR